MVHSVRCICGMEFGCLFCYGIINLLENQTGVYICLLEPIRPHRAVPMQGMYHRLDGKRMGQELWSRMLCHRPWANSRIPIFRCVPARMVGFCPFRARAFFRLPLQSEFLTCHMEGLLAFLPPILNLCFLVLCFLQVLSLVRPLWLAELLFASQPHLFASCYSQATASSLPTSPVAYE